MYRIGVVENCWKFIWYDFYDIFMVTEVKFYVEIV